MTSEVMRRRTSSEGMKFNLTDLNSHFVCVLCFGYFVDATTITECMHTFCKSCIVTFLQKNHHCPHCDTLLSRTKPFNSLKSDRVMQALVYKTVPGLFQTEMRRRIHFYTNHPHSDFYSDVADIQNYVFGPEDSISLSIKHRNESGIVGDGLRDTGGNNLTPERKKQMALIAEFKAIRYFRCPAAVPVSVLKSLVKNKYGVPDPFRVELLYEDECLLDSWTLMEVAYIFQWKRESPMELSFQVFATRKVKRKRLKLVRKVINRHNSENGHFDSSQTNGHEDSNSTEPPTKIPRLQEPPSSFSSTSSIVENHPRPPTPPETPDGPIDALLSMTQASERMAGETSEIFIDANGKQNSKPDITDSISIDGNTNLEDNGKVEENMLYDRSNNYPCDDGDSGDNACDQDSEAALEVDTSHDTETEIDVEMEDKEIKNGMDEEQGDSAIDVTELNETLDDSDCGKDQSFSSESFDEQKKLSIEEETIDVGTNEELVTKENTKTGNSADLAGVLDLSGHARTVRARKENSSSPETTEPDTNKKSNFEKLENHITQDSSFTPRNNSKDNPKNPLQNNQLKFNPEMLAKVGFVPGIGPLSRPPFPLDWTRGPLPNNPILPQNAAAFNLMHAVQFQLAMAAQAQVQAQAQKIQAQVKKASSLKNLNGTEILSFVNGSGDTLTISPITGKTECSKNKLGPKSVKLTKPGIANQKRLVPKKPQSKAIAPGSKVPKKEFNVSKDSISNFLSKPNCEIKTNNNNNTSKDNNNSFMKSNPAIKTTIPKSVLTSLKIPHVPIKKEHAIKSEKEKKEIEAEKERTGDPVFKITNQKILEYVRQQQKLKQNTRPQPNDTPTPTKSVSTNLNNASNKIFNNGSTTKSNNTGIFESSSALVQKSLNNPIRINGPTIKPTNKINAIVNKINIGVNKPALPVKQQSANGGKTVPTSLATISSNKTAPTPMNSNKTNLLQKNSNKAVSMPINNNKKVSMSINNNKTTSLSSNKTLTTSFNGNKTAPTLVKSPLPSNPLSKALSNKTPTSKYVQQNITKPTSICSSSNAPSTTTTLSNGVKLKTNSNANSNSSTETKMSTSVSSAKPTVFSSSASSNSTNCSTIRTTNTQVRQIPNPSRLHQQSENRLTAGMNRTIPSFMRKGITSSKMEGMSRIESVTRSLHEKVSASAGVQGTVLNSLAR